MAILGIDIGGTGIKGAPVDPATGQLTAERYRLPTPIPATPKAVSATVAQVIDHFNWKGIVGCGFPAAIREGQVLNASNIAKSWLGQNAQELFAKATGCAVTVANDADAAGYAEMQFGAGRSFNVDGAVLIVTLGTGIGTALFVRGQLVPNLELGHIEIKGKEAEKWAAAIVREHKQLSWKKWAGRLNTYLTHMQSYLWPDLIIIGGGISQQHDRFLPRLTLETQVVPAQMRNEAGIVGAALVAQRNLNACTHLNR
ncbi:MAG: polyphosphate glucokinase [Candidatus Entotheonella factor]|uniref:Polyphosphate glucokinase n=1 Tax=Entotheonella factor TaxID=1429438 RepID=W4L9H8_ENTF1|nr:ROK family protein [Candidatus Entotheonella palauensis]ETW94682.1 MAG: polyphosphate glucokinase [Candidatus Entotheonella factor]